MTHFRKKFAFLLILGLCFSFAWSNPFFNSGFGGNPTLPAKENSEEVSNQNDLANQSETSETVLQNQENKKSGPNPVLVGKTNEKLTVFQGDLREEIASFFRNWKNSEGVEKSQILWGIISVAFLYGMIHAAGPGHRKTIVFSLYIARKSPWYEPLITGFLLALLHGGCAIVLMLIFKGISGSISANTNAYTIYMEGFSYLLVIIVALFLIIKETVEFVKSSKVAKSTTTVAVQEKKTSKDFTRNNGFGDLVPFLISGLYPCPGAILVLVLSFTLDILGAGIAAVSFMSLGMAIPIIIVAYLAWFGRKGLFSALKNRESLIRKLSFGIEIFGYSLLILFSLYIAMPFFVSLF